MVKKVVEVFLEEKVAMPDDARERIILSQTVEENRPSKQQKDPLSNHASGKTTNKFEDYSDDGISSDHQDIREQAAKARDPEERENILSH